MANNNVQNVKFLRNGSLYANRTAALEGLNGQNLAAEQDGSIILARYGSGNEVKTLVGFVFFADTNSKSITIFDVDGASADVEELRTEINNKLGEGITSGNTATAQLTALSGSSSDGSGVTSVAGAKAYAKDYTDSEIDKLEYTGVTTGTGVYVKNVTEADGIIAAETESLPTVAAISEAGKPITAVSETLGEISASAGTIEAQYVTTNTTDKDFTGATVQAALEEIASKVKADKISSDDKTVTITTAATGTDVSVNIDGTTLVKDSSTGVISSNLKIKSISQGAGSTYASQYQLVYGDDNTAIGDVINVAKDQFLSGASYDAETQTLTLVMYNSTGGTTDVEVDFSEAIIESEAGEGLYVSTGHTLNVGVDANSEKVTTAQGVTADVLVVGEDSIKVQNIQNAIDYAVSTATNGLDSTVTDSTSGSHVTITIEQLDGKLVQSGLTIEESDIASQSKLDELSAKTFTVATSSNASITTATTAAADGTVSLDLITDASKIQMSGFTAAESGFTNIAQSSSVTDAFKVVETFVIQNEEIISNALNDLNERLSAETEARIAVDGQNGDTYVANSGKAYISGATSLNDADVKLNDALAALDADVVKTVKVNNIALTKTNNAVNVQISSPAASGTAASPINVITDSSTGAVTLEVQFLDCGTY